MKMPTVLRKGVLFWFGLTLQLMCTSLGHTLYSAWSVLDLSLDTTLNYLLNKFYVFIGSF